MADENPDSPEPQPEPEPEQEAHSLKKLAEEKYAAGNLKSALKYAKRSHRVRPSLDGVPEMLTALKILRIATIPVTSPPSGEAVSSTPSPPDYYKILQVERFAHINTIKKQYKKLALTLHPDKNPFLPSEEAFKHVGEAFRVLSDKIRRKEYDMRLRIAMQREAEAAVGGIGEGEVETFWTACSTCRLLHKFERKYLEHDLVCPSCKKSFKAVEVEEKEEQETESEMVGIRVSERIRARRAGKMSSVGEVLERSKEKADVGGNEDLKGKGKDLGIGGGGARMEGLKSRKGEVIESKRTKRAKVVDEETMTLAEMQILAIKKVSEEKMRGKEKGKEKKGIEKDGEKEKEIEKDKVGDEDRLKEKEKEKEKELQIGTVQERERRERLGVLKDVSTEIVGKRASKRTKDLEDEKLKKSRDDGLEIEVGNFYDFEKEKDKEKKDIQKDRENEDKEIENDEEREEDNLKEKEKELQIQKVKERERRGVLKRASAEVVGRRASKRTKDFVALKQKNSGRDGLEIVAVEEVDLYDLDKEKEKEKEKEKKSVEKDREKEKEMENDKEREEDQLKEKELPIGKVKERERRGVLKVASMESVGRRASKSIKDIEFEKRKKSRQDGLEIVAVEEVDIYDFGKNRQERGFKKGQVWATYDSDDGMPSRYALIDDVVSLNPFEVRLSWLEFQSNGDDQLVNWEKMGFHISCGRFKVSVKTSVKTLKMFSHIADFERTAREVYWIYPKKGSVWALYNENVLDSEGQKQTLKDKCCYDIVVFLTSYSEIHGMSMACLEKVDGFRTVFKRREIGAHAIRWLEKDDFRLFSHQIPARKLSGDKASGLSEDCWELDPSSLPPKQLTIGWGR